MDAHRNLVGSSVYAELSSQIAFSSDWIRLRNPANGAEEEITDPPPLICEVVGFAPYSTVHLYYIWGDGEDLSMVADSARPMVGPTFPTDYTHCCYAGSVRTNARGTLNRIEIRGKHHFFQNHSYWPPLVLDPSNPYWKQRSITDVAIGGVPAGLSIINDTGYPTVAFTISASTLHLLRPSDGDIQTINSPAAQQAAINNGPYLGYRDQAAAFVAGTDIHIYWMWSSGGGLSAVTSIRPPDIGPNMIGGATHWQYAGSTKCETNGAIPNPYIVPYIEQPTGVWTSADLAYAIPDYCETVMMYMDPQLVVNSGMAQSALYLSLDPDPNQFDAVYAINSCSVVSGGASSFFPQNYVETIPAPKVEEGKMLFYYRWADISGGGYIVHRWFSMYLRGYTVA